MTLAPKPPPYPLSQLSEGTRAYMRRFSASQSTRDGATFDELKQAEAFGGFDLLRKNFLGMKWLFSRPRKHQLEGVIHAAALSLSLVLLAAMFAFFAGDDLRIATNVVSEPTADNGLHTVHRSLHDQFSIPHTILHRIEASPPSFLHQSKPDSSAALQLLALLTRAEESFGSSRAIFATINSNTFGERVRAVASILTYAANTRRTPVIFWGVHPRRWQTSWLSSFKNTRDLSKRAVFVDYLLEDTPFELNLGNRTNTSNDLNKGSATENPINGNLWSPEEEDYENMHDWAEFSVIDVSQQVAQLQTHETPKPPTGELDSLPPTFWDSRARSSRTRDGIQSLDTVAAVDAHVSVVLEDETVSRYSPRFEAASLATSGALDGSGSLASEASTAYTFEYALANLTNEAISERLHNFFEIPRFLIGGMRPRMRLQLLRALLVKQASGIQAPRVMFIHVQFGLGNRLRALGSAMAFAKETDRAVVLIWEPDHHMNCSFRDLFVEQDDVIVSDSFEVSQSWPFENTRSQDPTAQKVVWYNFMRVNGAHVNDPSELVLDDKGSHIYVSSAYVVQSLVTPYIIRTQSPFWSVLKTLTPHIHVAKLVERLSQLPMEKMMGVHIRSKLIKTDILGVGVEEYSKESSSRTDYWRNLTQVDTFVDEMKRQSPSQLFYVAADQVDVLEKLQHAFPSRIYYTPRHCEGRDRECLPYALADILLLAKCPSIRGSYWSSFSEVAIRIGGGRVLLAGIDFGRPQLSKASSSNGPLTSSSRQSKVRPRRRRRRQSPTSPSNH